MHLIYILYIYITISTLYNWGSLRLALVLNCKIVVSDLQTSLILLRGISDEYPEENYESPYPASDGYNYCCTPRMALAVYNRLRLVCHKRKK